MLTPKVSINWYRELFAPEEALEKFKQISWVFTVIYLCLAVLGLCCCLQLRRAGASLCSGFTCGALVLGHVGFNSCGVRVQVVADSFQPCGLQPARLLCPQNFPARILEWVAISFSRTASDPGIEPVSLPGTHLGSPRFEQN